MSECTWTTKVEALHDGETAHAAGVEAHLETCGDCREYRDLLLQMSGGVAAVRQDLEIADPQFRVFMDGIREGIETKPSAWMAFWSRVSLVAAGFVLVVALSYIVTAGPVRTWASQFLEGGADEVQLLHNPGNPTGNPDTRKDLE